MQSTSDRLRIAFCLPEIEPLQQVLNTGAGDAAYIQQNYIASGLRRRGHTLTFVAPRGLDELVCGEDPCQVQTVSRTWTNGAPFALASKASWRTQQALGIPYLNYFSSYRVEDAAMRCLPGHDLVYERTGLYNVGVAMACRRLKLPYVVFFDADQIAEHDFMGKPITGVLRRRAEQIMKYNLDTASCIICVSEPARTALVNRRQVPPEKTVVFANGVDIQQFRPLPEAREQVRARLGVGLGPMLLFVGNFFQWHDVTTLLEAFALLLARCPDATLVMVGDGPRRGEAEAYAARLGISQGVKFTGLVAHAEVPQIIAAADIAAAPYPVTAGELWLSPMKLFEYMASGLAVVATATGQISEIVDDGQNGLLVPPEDPVALAGACERLVVDAALRLQLGRQARESVVRDHSWDQYVERLEAVLGAVAHREPPAAKEGAKR